MELKDLNSEQLKAVKHDLGPMLVVAGAGTGKTRVITHRIAYLIKQKQVKPEAILALTFTDKAAGEMLDRLDGLIGWLAYRVNVMTFHAFGAQILQRFGHHAGMHSTGEVIPEMSKSLLLSQHIPTAKLHYYGNDQDLIDFAAREVGFIEQLQDAGISVDRYDQYVSSLKPKDHHKLDIEEAQDHLTTYRLYEQLKRQNRLVDYNDQITLPIELLKQRPSVVENLQRQYLYVMVDEYQDTNGSQDELLRLFIKPGGNIFAVGDDDQAIYGFRGARLGNILGFADHFKVKQPLVLTENYRSSQAILDAAYAMIKHNDPDRLESRLGISKRLKALDQGQAPEFRTYGDSHLEQEAVAQDIKQRLAAGEDSESIAILATSHRVLRSTARALARHGVTYRLLSTINIFEQREVIQLWHILNWIGLKASDETIINLLSGPFVDWPSQLVRQVIDQSRKSLCSIEEAITQVGRTNKAAAKLSQQLDQWRLWSSQLPVSYLAYRLVFESGLGQDWVKQAANTPRMVRVFEDLQQWFKQMQQYEQVANDTNLAGYLKLFAQPPQIEAQEAIGSDSGVAVLTIHGSKGLEFETVYLTGATAEAWSDTGRVIGPQLPEELKDQSEDLPPEHERRRLIYVAMTRAKRNLIVTAPVLQPSGRWRRTNPILEEIFGQGVKLAQAGTKPSDRLQQSLRGIEQFAPPRLHFSEERLPFETADGWLELSTTQIEQYDRCPYEFYLEHVLKIKTPFGPQVAFGSLLHGLIADYYQGRLNGEKPSLKQLLAALEGRWSDWGYRSKDEATIAKQLAEATITAFFKREQTARRKVRSSEESFALSMGDAKLKLRGRIDASFEVPGGIEVRDFKTGRKHDPAKIAIDTRKSLQLRTYALAIEEITGQAPAQVVLDYIMTGVEGVAELTTMILKNHRTKLFNIAEAIRAKKFAPNAHPFHNCSSYRYWGVGDDDES